MKHLPAVAAVILLAAAPETIRLDFAEKRISERDFHAAKALRVGSGEAGIDVQAGASISARAIELVLRNVRGTVRFHADTSGLQRRVQPLSPLSPAPPPSPTPDQH